jgi:hypothetical protein
MMARDGQAGVELWCGLFFGGTLTPGIIAAVVLAIVNWDYFSPDFTRSSSQAGWRFAYSIR